MLTLKGGIVMKTYALDDIISGLKYPASGDDVLRACKHSNFPEDFLSEFSPLIEDETFNSSQELHSWLATHMTTHLAGKLGGASVHDLIQRAKSA
jgi:hypothetical protein